MCQKEASSHSDAAQRLQDLADDFPDKPRGMHRKTYQRLRDQEDAEGRSWPPWIVRNGPKARRDSRSVAPSALMGPCAPDETCTPRGLQIWPQVDGSMHYFPL